METYSQSLVPDASLIAGHSILRGSVWHHRHREMNHSFSYPILMLALDLDMALPSFMPLFRVDKLAILSLRTRDFLLERDSSTADVNKPIRQRLSSLVAAHEGLIDITINPPDTVLLLTTPRFFGYAFNPVNFYLCSWGGITEQLVCEVHNTFGQTHRYVAQRLSQKGSQGEAIFEFPKQFCVSPFLDRSGSYRVTVSTNRPQTLSAYKPEAPHLSVKVELFHGETCSFVAGISGALTPLTSVSLLRALLAVPSSGWLTMTRISLQALALIRRRVTPYPLLPLKKPSYTPRSRSRIEQLRLRVLSAITRGAFSEKAKSDDL